MWTWIWSRWYDTTHKNLNSKDLDPMSRVCRISKKKYNNANRVSHSKRRTKHRQKANLQWKRFWLPEEKRWVRLRVSTKVMKTITKYGLMATIKRYGADPSIIK